MKTKKYNTVRTVQICNSKVVETEARWIPLTHMDMTDHYPGLVDLIFRCLTPLSAIFQLYHGDQF